MSIEKIEDYTPHIDEVMGLIDDDTPRETIEEELRHNCDYYRLSIDDSKRRVVRQHGGCAECLFGDMVFSNIDDIVDEDTDYNIRSTVISCSKEQRGSKMTTSGMMIDATGQKKKFVIWEEVELDIGKPYAFKRCRLNKKYDNLSISYGSNVVRIKGSSDSSDPMRMMMDNALDIAELDSDSGGRTICATVDSIVDDSSNFGPYKRIIFRDDTGARQFNDWANRSLIAGKRYLVTNIKVKEGNYGRLFFSIDKNSMIMEVE